MSLPARKFLSLLALSFVLAACRTHDRTAYENPLPWKSHPVAPAETPPLLPEPSTTDTTPTEKSPPPTPVPPPAPATQPETAPPPGTRTPGPVDPGAGTQ